MKKNKVIAIVGPTASGKTSYSIELAKKINGEIVSADSRLVYKGLDIGTAKPTKKEMSKINHYMIDIVEPNVDYSAGLYVSQAKECIYDILSRGKTPIVVGGTGLYFRLLLEDYDMPPVEPNKELRSELNLKTYDELCQIMSKMDAKALKSVENNDKKKLIRYIEIVSQTGLSLEKSRGKKDREFDVEWLGLNYPRSELYERINKRVDLMVEQGLLAETKNLLKKYGRIQNIIDTIGYREMIMVLDNVLSMNDAVDKLKQNSRNYAKRQLTWFRKNDLIKWNYYPDKLER